MTVYVATKNAGKLRELEAVFAGAGFALRTFDAYADPVEGDSSYADNAALKARALRAQLLRRASRGTCWRTTRGWKCWRWADGPAC